MRFGLLAISTTQDVRFSEDKVQQGQQLANKLFNATRFVLLQLDELGLREIDASAPEPRTDADRWLLSHLERTARETAAALDGFEFAKAALGLYDFVYGTSATGTWSSPSRGCAAAARRSRRRSPPRCSSQSTAPCGSRNPVIPFVTEELWSYLPGDRACCSAPPGPSRAMRRSIRCRAVDRRAHRRRDRGARLA